MKQCPNCGTTYTDETLRFCLTDGATLESVAIDEKTAAFDRNRVRVDFQKDSAPESVNTVISPPFSPPQNAEKKGTNWAIVGVLGVLLVFVLLGFAGFAGYVFYTQSGSDNKHTAVNSPTPNVSPTRSGDKKLEEKVANLEKQLEEQKDKNTTNSSNPFPTETPTAERTARANSPGDGFLALRSLPSTETGERLAKIPHGAPLTVLDCPKPTNPGKMKGSWCRVIYNGQEGWAFDAYMKFE